MKAVIYTSEIAPEVQEREKQLDKIVSKSVANNHACGVTGVLLQMDGRFIQVVEGDDPVVDGLFKKIRCDARHRNIEVLFDNHVSARGFPDWSMRGLAIQDKRLFNLESIRRIEDVYRSNFRFEPHSFVNLLVSIFEDSATLTALTK